jgi:hypothetical protein
MTRHSADLRIECYLRGDTYGTYDRQQAMLQRVDALESEGVLADAEVDASWQRIRTPEQDSRDDAVETYEEFRQWAETNGYSLEPAFERRQRSYVGTDVVHDVVVFPLVSAAVYEGNDLVAVLPSSDETGEIHFGVQDCLDALEAGETEWLEQFARVSVDRVEPRLTATV